MTDSNTVTLDSIGAPVEQADAYKWVAYYDDGTALMEEGPDGSHRFADIDQARVREFVLVPQRLGLPGHAVHVEDPWRLIFYRRHAIRTDGATWQSPRVSLHVIGRQATIGGVNVKHLTGITEDGCSYTTSDDDLLVA